MRTINRRDALLAAMAATFASTARGAGSFSVDSAILEVDGQLACWLRTVGGGTTSFAELQDAAGGQALVATAPTIGGLKLSLRPIDTRPGFLQWASSAVGKGAAAKSVNVIYHRGDYEFARLSLANVIVSSFSVIVNLNQNTPEGALFAIELNANATSMQVKTATVPKPPYTGNNSKRVVANLSLAGVVDGTDDTVTMGDLKCRAVAPATEPLILPFELQLSAAKAAPFLDWARDWYAGRRSERTGVLRLLEGPSMVETGRIDLQGVGIQNFTPLQFRPGDSAEIRPTLTCRSIKASIAAIGGLA
jgi:hypothetical protein